MPKAKEFNEVAALEVVVQMFFVSHRIAKRFAGKSIKLG